MHLDYCFPTDAKKDERELKETSKYLTIGSCPVDELSCDCVARLFAEYLDSAEAQRDVHEARFHPEGMPCMHECVLVVYFCAAH